MTLSRTEVTAYYYYFRSAYYSIGELIYILLTLL